ncbi:MAG: hypothetical protein Q7J98_12335 [Kiritimatiellia bacterium]|nr:hypothetical protein [Kiritimatiellia bacterium]
MIKYFALFSLLASSLLFAGCASMPGGIAASNTPLHAKPYTVIGETEGSDSQYAILGIIPVTSANSLKRAIKNAKGNCGADALVDITVDCNMQWWVLFTRTVTEVSAKGIRFKGAWEGDNEVKR